MYYGYNARGGPVGVGDATAKSMVVALVLTMVHQRGLHVLLLGRQPEHPGGWLRCGTGPSTTRGDLLLIGFGVLFAWWAIGTRSQDHHVKAAFPTAFNLAPGMDVQVDGIDAGKISKVEYKDGRSVVEIGINEERYWPLHDGTTVKQRWGTTIGSGTRLIELEPGPANAPELEEGGIIERKYTRRPSTSTRSSARSPRGPETTCAAS